MFLFVFLPVLVASAAHEFKILGGDDCGVDQFPFVVKINVNINGHNGTCTGSIISRKHILTASHCVIKEGDKSLRVLPPHLFTVFGPDLKTGSPVKYAVSRVKAHYNYDGAKHNDIAVLEVGFRKFYDNQNDTFKLRDGFPDDERVISIVEDDEKYINTGSKLTVIGFGYAVYGFHFAERDPLNPLISSKHEVGMHTKENHVGGDRTANSLTRANAGKCRFTQVPIRNIDDCGNHLNLKLTKGIEFCAGYVWKGTQLGDSGGPIIAKSTSSDQIQIGLTSFGKTLSTDAGNPIDFGIYTRISAHCEWIKDATEKEVECEWKT